MIVLTQHTTLFILSLECRTHPLPQQPENTMWIPIYLHYIWKETVYLKQKKIHSASVVTCSALSPGGIHAYSSNAQPLSSSLGKPE